MAKKYCKYTKEQLQEYCNDESYCVKCVDGTVHIGLPPWGLKKFDETVRSIVCAEKLNRFDSKLNGIVLDIQSIKVIGEQYAVRNDSSALHVSLNVKFYVFQPRIGAVVLGIVKHVALHHISVTIHRFFNVMIPIEVKNSALKTNMTVMIKLTKFDLDDSIPYFEGKLEEILGHDQKENSVDSGVSTTDSTNIRVKREQISKGQMDSESDSDSDISKPIVKREIGHTNNHHSPIKTITKVKVKQEPVSSSSASSSDSELSTGAEKSTNKFKLTHLQVKLKRERNSDSSSGSDDSSTSSTERDKTIKLRQASAKTVQATDYGKRKRESGSSVIGRSLLRMNEFREDDSKSSSASESDDENRTKIKNNSMCDSSFASPGLSSTRIATTTKAKKSKTKSTDSGTNQFLKKMMSRFNK